MKGASDFVAYDVSKNASENECVAYDNFCNAFSACLQMSSIWQVSESADFVTTSARRLSVSWCMADNRPYILPSPTPAVNTLTGGPIYFYPRFAVHYISNVDYEVWNYDQIEISVDNTSYMEEASLAPKDSEIIDKTWLFTTKNGSPDLRYSHNPQMLILKYGVVEIKTPIGTLVYYTSQYDCISKLGVAFDELRCSMGVIISGSQDSIIDTSLPLQPEKMERCYFDRLTQVVKDLYDFADEQVKSVAMQRLLDAPTTHIEIEISNRVLTEKKDIVFTLIGLDLIMGHTLMEHKIDLRQPQFFGLLLFDFMRINGRSIPYSYVDNLEDDLYETGNNFIQQVFHSMSIQQCGLEEFMFLKLVKQCGEECFDAYKIKIYRYFSVASKGDGVVTEKEKTFLSSIMQFPYECSDDTGKYVNKDQLNTTTNTDENAEPICAIDELIGLTTVKQEIEQLRNFVKIQQLRTQKGLKNSNVSYHCVFTGNPGTGKTTVARIVASIYKQLGVLKKGHLIETDRAGLVGEYVGQTAVKTNKKIDEALDGVLFIDEAYSLVGEGTDFGKEAIATLLKRLEDDRERLVVILAGYTDEMKQFIATNPGLQSRFNRYIDFPDYSADELMQIFEFNLQKYEYTITHAASDAMKQYFEYAVNHKDKSFGNARFVRNIFERTIELQANRLASISNLTKEELSVIELEDLPIKEK